MSPISRRYIPSTAILMSVLAMPAVADVRITGILDGTLSGGAPKAIELYVSGTEDLGAFELWRSTNGDAFGKAADLPAGTYTDAFVYLVGTAGEGLADFVEVFGTDGDFGNVVLVSSTVSGNGNDGFQIVDGSGVVDQVWQEDATDVYEDSYMYRQDGTGPDGAWVEGNWQIPGNNVLDGLDAQGVADAVPFGTYDTESSAEEQCGDPITPIYAIQGSGAASPIAGETVRTEGIVVADFEDGESLRGFYIQDPTGDGDPLTSDALFVYQGDADEVNNGDPVRVKGKVQEWFGETQISSVQSVKICEQGLSIPPTQIGQMPFPEPVDGVDYLERYEGMYVEFPQTLYVTELFRLGRFGQLTLSVDGRLIQFTDENEPDFAGFEAYLGEIARRQVILDDMLQVQNPDPIIFPDPELTAEPDQTVRGGMTVTGLQGVLTFTWNGTFGDSEFRVRPVSTSPSDVPMFDPVPNPRPEEPPALDGTLEVVSFNLQNYFVTLSEEGDNLCGPLLDQGCRGARNPEEFDRQTAKIVNAILAMDADVYALSELENNGFGPGSAARALVDAVNAQAGEERYDVVALPPERVSPISGMGFVDVADVISVGFIYKVATVAPAPGTQVAVLDDAAASILPIAGELSFPLFDGDTTNRASLAASFQELASGEIFTVFVNHFKSKGSSDKDEEPACQVSPPTDPNCDFGDGQGFWNARRTDASRALASWIDQDPTLSGSDNVVIAGDLNAYAKEDPISELVENQGYTDLADAFIPDAYSFVFDGQWGYLDYVLVRGNTLNAVVDVAEWHNNADEPSVLGYETEFKSSRHVDLLYSPEPFRTSDHDPLIVTFDLMSGVPGDLDGDGKVDFRDFSILRDARGTCEGDPGYLPEADFDDSGCIDIRDLIIWIGYWRGNTA